MLDKYEKRKPSDTPYSKLNFMDWVYAVIMGLGMILFFPVMSMLFGIPMFWVLTIFKVNLWYNIAISIPTGYVLLKMYHFKLHKVR